MKKFITAATGCMLMLGALAQVQAQDQIVPYVSTQQAPVQTAAPVQTTAPIQTAAPVQASPIVGTQTMAPTVYYPGTSIPGFQPFPQPINPGLPGLQPQPIYPPAYNPAVIQTPTQLQSVQYDQFGRVILNTGSQTVFNSALNPGRNQVVPGTLRNVNRYELDAMGNRVHVTGQQWIGLDGQPHANLNRQTVTTNGNGTVINNNSQIQSYSTSGK